MKQKITVIALLCALVFSIVGAYFLYEHLTPDTPGGQLAVVGGGNSSDTSKPSEDEGKQPSADQSDTSGNEGSSDNTTDNGSSGEGSSDNTTDNGSSGEGSENTPDQSDPQPDHDHGDESEDHGDLIKAYDFKMYDVNGSEVKLSDFFGKPIVLNFWASWCGPCQSEMPAFNEVYNEYKDKIHFVMVSIDDTMKDAKKFITDNGYSLPVYHDTDYEGSAAYGVSAIPLTYFIDKNGYLTAYGNFPFDKPTLMQGINMIYTP